MSQVHMEVSPFVNNVIGFFRTDSFFNSVTGNREIDKKDASLRKIAGAAEGISKNSASRMLKEAIANGIIVDAGDRYLVMEPKGSYVSLDMNFYKKMINTFNSDTNNIYLWLRRRYNYMKSQGKYCRFSKGQIVVEALGKYNNSTNRQKVEDMLTQLVVNGIIGYRIVRVGNTYLRELSFIGEKFVVSDALQQCVRDVCGGKETTQSNVDRLCVATSSVVCNVGLQEGIKPMFSLGC